jgi:hypothetical protein
MFRIVSETLQISEVASSLRVIMVWVNEGINIAEDKLSQIYGAVVDGGKTVSTHDKTKTTRGGDTTRTVKTYKTDETVR